MENAPERLEIQMLTKRTDIRYGGSHAASALWQTSAAIPGCTLSAGRLSAPESFMLVVQPVQSDQDNSMRNLTQPELGNNYNLI
ncbi:MAG TPA: hypothetical protein VGB17_13585 [Pyrinomonadaceae bacterium]